MDIHWADAASKFQYQLMSSVKHTHRVVVLYIFQEVKLTLILGLTALYDRHVDDSVEGLKYLLIHWFNEKNHYNQHQDPRNKNTVSRYGR